MIKTKEDIRDLDFHEIGIDSLEPRGYLAGKAGGFSWILIEQSPIRMKFLARTKGTSDREIWLPWTYFISTIHGFPQYAVVSPKQISSKYKRTMAAPYPNCDAGGSMCYGKALTFSTDGSNSSDFVKNFTMCLNQWYDGYYNSDYTKGDRFWEQLHALTDAKNKRDVTTLRDKYPRSKPTDWSISKYKYHDLCLEQWEKMELKEVLSRIGASMGRGVTNYYEMTRINTFTLLSIKSKNQRNYQLANALNTA